MQDRSHKLLFLGLTALMSAAAFYGSEAGPTLLIGKEMSPSAVGAVFTPRNERASLDGTDLSKTPLRANLTVNGTCSAAASDGSPLCPATAKISLSSP